MTTQPDSTNRPTEASSDPTKDGGKPTPLSPPAKPDGGKPTPLDEPKPGS